MDARFRVDGPFPHDVLRGAGGTRGEEGRGEGDACHQETGLYIGWVTCSASELIRRAHEDVDDHPPHCC